MIDLPRITTIALPGSFNALREYTVIQSSGFEEFFTVVPTIIPTPTPTPTPTPIWPPEIYGEVPSSKALDVIGDDMLYPKASSYLAEYETMYVKSTKGQGIYAYWAPKTDEEYKKIDAILEATEVTVLARENGMSCVIFINQRDHRHAAWVNSTRLVYEYK